MLAALALVAMLPACTVAPGGRPADGITPLSETGPLPPAGLGTLRQDDVTISVRRGALQMKVTPLAERILRATAPDTYRRLHGLAEQHGGMDRPGDGAALFLVSFFSAAQGTPFAPEDLNLVSRGLRLRPARISPLTPDWGQYRLEQRRTQMAVYTFQGDVDLESELVILYDGAESAEWNVIRPRVEAELARVRARGQTSSSYREILR